MVYSTLALTNAQNSAATNLHGNISHLAVGSGTTTPDVSDTALETETYREATLSNTVNNNIVTSDIRLDITENNGNTINEIGTFDAASSGNLYTRNSTTSFAKTSDKEAYYRVKNSFIASN